MGKSKKNRDKDKRSYAYYDDHSSSKKTAKKSKDKTNRNKEFVDWDTIV